MTDEVLREVNRVEKVVLLDLPEGMYDLYFGADSGPKKG